MPSVLSAGAETTLRHGLSKPGLQDIVNAQKDKWPVSVYGKFTQKTNMATMRAALLDPELGFIIQVLDSESAQPNLNLPEVQDEGRVLERSDESQTTAVVDVNQPAEGVVIDSGEFVMLPGCCQGVTELWHCSLFPKR